MQLKLTTSIIRNGVYFPAGAVISINPSEAGEMSAYGKVVAEAATKAEGAPVEKPEEKTVTAKKGKK